MKKEECFSWNKNSIKACYQTIFYKLNNFNNQTKKKMVKYSKDKLKQNISNNKWKDLLNKLPKANKNINGFKRKNRNYIKISNSKKWI